jgi:hypothetical protein
VGKRKPRKESLEFTDPRVVEAVQYMTETRGIHLPADFQTAMKNVISMLHQFSEPDPQPDMSTPEGLAEAFRRLREPNQKLPHRLVREIIIPFLQTLRPPPRAKHRPSKKAHHVWIANAVCHISKKYDCSATTIASQIVSKALDKFQESKPSTGVANIYSKYKETPHPLLEWMLLHQK